MASARVDFPDPPWPKKATLRTFSAVYSFTMVDSLSVSMDADVFSKFDGLATTEVLHQCERTIRFSGERFAKQPVWSSFASFEGGSIREETVQTPNGVLTHAWKYEAESGAPFESEHWWKHFEAEYAAVRSWMGIRSCSW